jgi:hypothetical protein
MIEERDLFERAVQRFAPTDDALERLLNRRDRKRRNQRIAAGAVASRPRSPWRSPVRACCVRNRSPATGPRFLGRFGTERS